MRLAGDVAQDVLQWLLAESHAAPAQDAGRGVDAALAAQATRKTAAEVKDRTARGGGGGGGLDAGGGGAEVRGGRVLKVVVSAPDSSVCWSMLFVYVHVHTER